MENKNLWIVVGVVVALIVAFPLLAQLKHNADRGEAAPAATADTASAPAAAAPLAAPTLNASNLVGTSWKLKGYTVQLGAGGTATATTMIGVVQGTWSVNGATLTISAMGQTANAQISGDQILVNGTPAERVQ